MCCVLFYFSWIYVWLEGCVTGLPDCELGCGYDLLTVVFGGRLWEVDLLCSYPSWVVNFL